MLGWLRPSYPIDDATRAWVDYRMAWLVGEFGWERLRRSSVVLPTEEWFPDEYDGDLHGARCMLERVSTYMDVDSSRVDLRLFSDSSAASSPAVHIENASSPAGVYHEENGRTIVWLEQTNLSDPLATAATIAHELCHARLLGEGRLSGDEEDHELLTDLTSVYFGLGVILANASLRERNWRSEGWEGWSVSWQGYLTAPVFGYALAVFAAWRQEQSPRWSKHLRPDARAPFRQSLRVLERSRAPLPTAVSSPPALSPMLQKLALRANARQQESERHDDPHPTPPAEDGAEFGEAGIADEGEDCPFTAGLALAEEGRHAEAVEAFSEAIRRDAEDGEACQHRAASLAELERYAEAQRDAERAVALDPDDYVAGRTLGLALLRQGEYRAAVEEFHRVLRDYDDVLAYHYRGEAWARLDEYRKAIADFTRVIRRAPQWIEAYVHRGLCYELLQQPKEADRDRRAAERLRGG